MTKGNESIEDKEVPLSEGDRERIESLSECIDDLVVQLNPKLRERDIKFESRLSTIEGQLGTLKWIVGLGLPAFMTFITIVVQFLVS